MNFFLLLFYRICWVSIPFTIAFLIAKEDSLLNPGETEAYVNVILAAIFIAIGSSTLSRIIKTKDGPEQNFLLFSHQ